MSVIERPIQLARNVLGSAQVLGRGIPKEFLPKPPRESIGFNDVDRLYGVDRSAHTPITLDLFGVSKHRFVYDQSELTFQSPHTFILNSRFELKQEVERFQRDDVYKKARKRASAFHHFLSDGQSYIYSRPSPKENFAMVTLFGNGEEAKSPFVRFVLAGDNSLADKISPAPLPRDLSGFKKRLNFFGISVGETFRTLGVNFDPSKASFSPRL